MASNLTVRDRSEIAELHGTDGELEAATLRSGERRASQPGTSATDTAVVVVGRVALALVGARMTPTTHASIAERDDIEVGLNRRVATRPAASPAS